MADVVHDRRGQEQVAVQAAVQVAELAREGRHRNRVLEQTAEVRVVAVARAWRAARGCPQLGVGKQRVDQRAVAGVVNLRAEVLEEAIELVHVSVRDRQERLHGHLLATIGIGLGPADVGDLDHQVLAEAFDSPDHGDKVSALEAPGQSVRVAEGTGLHGTGAVA